MRTGGRGGGAEGGRWERAGGEIARGDNNDNNPQCISVVPNQCPSTIPLHVRLKALCRKHYNITQHELTFHCMAHSHRVLHCLGPRVHTCRVEMVGGGGGGAASKKGKRETRRDSERETRRERERERQRARELEFENFNIQG